MADIVIRFVAVTDQYEAALATVRRLAEQTTGQVSQQAEKAAQAVGSIGQQAEKTAQDLSKLSSGQANQAAQVLTQQANQAAQAIGQIGQQSSQVARTQETLRQELDRTFNQITKGGQQISQAMAQAVLALPKAQQQMLQHARNLGTALGDIAVGGDAAKEILDKLGSSLTKISLGASALGAALAAPFLIGIHEAAEFEQSMIGLRRVLGFFEGQEGAFEGIAQGLRDISSQSGMATDKLAGIAEQALDIEMLKELSKGNF